MITELADVNAFREIWINLQLLKVRPIHFVASTVADASRLAGLRESGFYIP